MINPHQLSIDLSMIYPWFIHIYMVFFIPMKWFKWCFPTSEAHLATWPLGHGRPPSTSKSRSSVTTKISRFSVSGKLHRFHHDWKGWISAVGKWFQQWWSVTINRGLLFTRFNYWFKHDLTNPGDQVAQKCLGETILSFSPWATAQIVCHDFEDEKTPQEKHPA